MADKECTVYIVDVGQSTGQKRHGRDLSDLDWAMQYVWDKIAATVRTGRKTLYSGLLALRSDETNHDGPHDEEYQNLTSIKEPAQILMPDIAAMREKIKPSKTNDGDAISAIVVAIQMIAKFCDTRKFKKNIILVTNADGNVDEDSIDDIATKTKEDGIHLVILIADMDDREYGFKEEDKDENKQKNEVTLKTLVNLAGGDIGTLKQATDELKVPQVKLPRSMPTFKGKLCLGDSSMYHSAMEIDVERYPKIMVASSQSAKRVAVKSDDALESQQIRGDHVDSSGQNDDATLVNQTTLYEIKDDRAPRGKRDIDRQELSKGYTYGRSIVHVEPADEDSIKFETNPGLHIIGFVPRENIEPFMEMSRTSVVIAQKTNDLAAMALSSFIHTLYELDTCAVARLVTKEDRPPVIVALTPSIEAEFECLIDVELPFAEDFRQHKFPPLDKIPTISGKVLTEHRLLPKDDLQQAMSAYVDSMDLSRADRDEDGEKTDYLKLEDSFSPKLHRLDDAIQHRAIHPKAPTPPTNDILLRFSHPPEKVTKHAKKHLERLSEAADIKKIPPKSLSRRNFGGKKAQEAPLSGLDISALLNARPAVNEHRISPENAIPEFKQIVANAENVETIQQCVSQLGDIIKIWVKNSTGDINYGRAVEGIRAMREECIDFEEPGLFNEFLRELKTKIFNQELGGDRREMWWQVRTNKLGLIEKKYHPQSKISEEEAREFLIPDRTKA